MIRAISCFTLTLLLAMCTMSAPQTATVSNAKKKSWTQLAELTPTNRSNQDWFGVSAAISRDTVVVGAFDPNIEATGSAYVFVKSGPRGNMTQTATLMPSDGGAGFGTSVAISGDTIIVGAADASNLDFGAPQGQGPGAAYIFVKPPSGWTDMTETAKLTASDGNDGDAFGYNVSISGNTAPRSDHCSRTAEREWRMCLSSRKMAGPA
jgi:hypothetical protein